MREIPGSQANRSEPREEAAGPRVRLVHVTTVPMTLAFVEGQVAYMQQRGFEIVALSSPGADLDEFAQRTGVPVGAVTMARRITPLCDLLAVVKMIRHFRRVRPHIVHAHTPKGGLLGTMAAWSAGVPVRIYHIRGLPVTAAAGVRRSLLRWTERTACLLANRVLCVSHSIRDVAIAEGLCAADKIVVLQKGSGNGVDGREKFNPARWDGARGATRHALGIAEDAKVVGFVGRLVRDKGLVELVASWQVLRRDFPDLHLLIVGFFESHEPLPPELMATLQSDPRIHLTGRQREPQRFYAAMDVVVLPTYREGFPNVPLEAAAMSLPVVATHVPGCVDAVQDGVTGTLVPARDAGALIDAVRRYLRDPSLRREHGTRGRMRVLAEFGQERLWEALHAEYTRLLSEDPRTAARGAGLHGRYLRCQTPADSMPTSHEG